MKRNLVFISLIVFLSVLNIACDVTASKPNSFELEIVSDAAHSASGRVISNISIDAYADGCPSISTCKADFDSMTELILTAIPDVGSHFTSWAGDCSGTSPICSLTMTSSKQVKALFDKDIETKHVLTVTKTGTGTGTVKDGFVDSFIDCGVHCSKDILEGTTVVLAAIADTGFVFSAWSGDCASAGTSTSCIVTMTGAKNVVARFDSISTCIDPVVIPDLFLRIAIKGQLGISGDISCAQLESLTKLNSNTDASTVNSKKIVSLSGLEHAVNLETLILSYNKITSISPIASLKKLNTLYLDHNIFSNIDALKVLPSLNQLVINNNFISTIVALVDNTGLSGAGDNVVLEQNCLNIDPFASASDKPDIDKLIARGVNVTYSPQKLPKTCP